MSDNLRRYRAILQEIRQWYPSTLTKQQARHLTTLAMLISGIVGSQHTHLDQVATQVPGATKPASRTKRFARFLANDSITAQIYFLPFAAALIGALAHRPLVFIMDGSTVGRGCVALLVSLVYRGRALPIAWIVTRGAKGHFPEDVHLRLLHHLMPLVPRTAAVVFLGDGEFDSILLQQTVDAAGWRYVCRTASTMAIQIDEEWVTCADLTGARGSCIAVSHVGFTRQAYGPVQVIAWWDARTDKPLYLVTNMILAEEACWWYRKRFHIETFFSDQKSRGFRLDKSHLADPVRVLRLMIAACLAYLWIIDLGTLAHVEGWVAIIHRTDRCDLSLFQLGLRVLEHFLNAQIPIPVAFLPIDVEFA
jgi:DDE family transposase